MTSTGCMALRRSMCKDPVKFFCSVMAQETQHFLARVTAAHTTLDPYTPEKYRRCAKGSTGYITTRGGVLVRVRTAEQTRAHRTLTGDGLKEVDMALDN